MTRGPLRVAVFASGSGSNFQAIADAVNSGKLDIQIELLVCDKPKAKAVERAGALGIPALVLRPKSFESREAYEQAILAELKERQIELVVLAGYMRIVGSTLLDAYMGRIVNIHPSLLPSFPGLDAIGQALAHGVRVTGVTVHFVDGGMDTGPIIAQRAVEIRPEDTADTLAERIHAVEHQLFPEVLQWIRDGRVGLDESGTRVVYK
jgi:phosphoribosylglycinamide formyltransferase 1